MADIPRPQRHLHGCADIVRGVREALAAVDLPPAANADLVKARHHLSIAIHRLENALVRCLPEPQS